MTEHTNEQKMQDWAKEQFRKANQYLAQEGILFDSVIMEECRYLAPFLAIWKIKALDKQVYWVITGDLPADLTLAENAPSAREAIKFFSMRWQLKAENLEQNSQNPDAEQIEFIKILRNRAESMYALQQNDKLWQLNQ